MATILQAATFLRLNLPNETLLELGRACSAECRRANLEIHKAPAPAGSPYASVNDYPAEALAAVFSIHPATAEAYAKATQ